MARKLTLGVTGPRGFRAGGIHAGVKAGSPEDKLDLAIVTAERPCEAAAVFTMNRVQAAPVKLSREILAKSGHKLQTIVLNSGNANCCAPNDMENARRMVRITEQALGIDAFESAVAVASTGVIGTELNIDVIEKAIPQLALNVAMAEVSAFRAADAIMTTDTVRKSLAVQYHSLGNTVTIGAMAKGSGMIHPNMGTLLCVVTTDADLPAAKLQLALRNAVDVTLNRVSVDGDMSTNDSVFLLGSGYYATEYEAFCEALTALLTSLARMIAADGEGATHLITCSVKGATDEYDAETLAKSVINSSLVKAAIFGSDANFGRILCALGYTDVDFDPNRVDIEFASTAGNIEVCRAGHGLAFDESHAKYILRENEIEIKINLHLGQESATCWGCDLTYDYVKINGDYRS
ncbi:MAG: bifunctional glutamate N-acetyltransferase/amino-acid acetyltransferase ArgJ [Oscillospiraceae bacterium]|jgi:glutamate N-acetyltransferase/amino-acid N-acetyltransferase|nr:bifunctional glutamate N-acetyltransferase/amino-acid acetyltransferase ArgJ [Oscillospiraceae bacterium]